MLCFLYDKAPLLMRTKFRAYGIAFFLSFFLSLFLSFFLSFFRSFFSFSPFFLSVFLYNFLSFILPFFQNHFSPPCVSLINFFSPPRQHFRLPISFVISHLFNRVWPSDYGRSQYARGDNKQPPKMIRHNGRTDGWTDGRPHFKRCLTPKNHRF